MDVVWPQQVATRQWALLGVTVPSHTTLGASLSYEYLKNPENDNLA